MFVPCTTTPVETVIVGTVPPRAPLAERETVVPVTAPPRVIELSLLADTDMAAAVNAPDVVIFPAELIVALVPALTLVRASPAEPVSFTVT